MKLRILIVDDEPLGRERIRTLLAGDPEVEIAGECADGKQAVAAIRRLKPDLIFLDVQMPEMDGFGVLESLEVEEIPATIFVTAYDRYAVKAFEVHAVDYLLKSFDRERFSAALARAKGHLARGKKHDIEPKLVSLLEAFESRKKYIGRLVVKSGGRIIFLRVEEIHWIEAMDNYVRLHAGAQTHTVRETMQSLETKLDPAKFARIHRSTIVNLDRVQDLRPLFHGDYAVRLRDGTELTLSRSYREKLPEPLGSGG